MFITNVGVKGGIFGVAFRCLDLASKLLYVLKSADPLKKAVSTWQETCGAGLDLSTQANITICYAGYGNQGHNFCTFCGVPILHPKGDEYAPGII